jgi:hypothetical protein
LSTRSGKIAAVANAQVKERGGVMFVVLSSALDVLTKLQVESVNVDKLSLRSDARARRAFPWATGS